MQRVTITIDEDLAGEIDRLAKKRGYQNRSEAIRDLARSGLRQAAEDSEARGNCVAALAYVYEHEARDLSRRLTEIFHEHHELTVSAMHVHLDHSACLELNVLRGDARAVRHVAEHVIAERGVRHGRLVMFPAEITHETHAHAGHSPRPHLHTHAKKAG
jgi:CopG family nickel-responsive transcriptional regulator